jgi:hypothetical protein
VQAQGWGLIPIWSGLQPPCACLHGIGTYPTCTTYTSSFSSDPTDDYSAAYGEGQSEADNAYASVTGLGLDGSVIYVDLEHYDDSSTYPYCGAAVQAFLSGWDSEMHADGGSGSAGVYGSASNVSSDFATATPPPDDVWAALYNRAVTVWHWGHGISDSVWPNSQRIKQYLNSVPEQWGGLSFSYGIDTDIVDATIYDGNGVKGYSFTTGIVQYPGSPFSFMTGLNNEINNDTADPILSINSILGDYYSPDWSYMYGYIYNQSGISGTTLSYSLDSETFVTGPSAINNKGIIVGFYDTYSDDIGHGFKYSTTTGTYSNLDYPGAIYTGPLGINDAGWVVGTWEDSGGASHCFFGRLGRSPLSIQPVVAIPSARGLMVSDKLWDLTTTPMSGSSRMRKAVTREVQLAFIPLLGPGAAGQI